MCYISTRIESNALGILILVVNYLIRGLTIFNCLQNCASNNRLLKSPIMARGNQRDKAREKAAKADKGKGKAASEQDGNKGLSKEQRQQRDADIMRQKQEKKAAQAAATAAGK